MSAITGEAEPVECNAKPTHAPQKLFDSSNIAFSGSFCVEGEGLGLVIRTGADTV